MKNGQLAAKIGISVRELDYFLNMRGEDIIKDDNYIALLGKVDRPVLEKTLPQIRAVYEERLPDFAAYIEKRYKLDHNPMSAYTLGNWVVGALQFPAYVNSILDMHEGLAAEMFANELPALLAMVEDTPGSVEWQRALCLFSLPLIQR